MTDWAGFAWLLLSLTCSCILLVLSVIILRWCLVASACFFQCVLFVGSLKRNMEEHQTEVSKLKRKCSFNFLIKLIYNWDGIFILIKSGCALCVDCILYNILSSVLIILDYRRSKHQKRKHESRRIQRCVKLKTLDHLA